MAELNGIRMDDAGHPDARTNERLMVLKSAVSLDGGVRHRDVAVFSHRQLLLGSEHISSPNDSRPRA